MRILLTGSKSQLARCLRDRIPEDWETIATDSASLDITDADAVCRMIQNFQPDAVVNTAAYTAVDKAEGDATAAFAVNASAVYNLASAAHRAHARFIHISTDYVFDSQADKPYLESDFTNPPNIYGKSKAAGELLALSANPDSLILRTSWLFSEYGDNFVRTMLNRADERSSLPVVSNQTGCPTYAGDLAAAIIRLLQQTSPVRGIYHYVGGKSVSWYEFAQHIFQAASQQQTSFPVPELTAVSDKEYPTAAPRPAYSILDCRKIENDFGIKPSDWQKALAQVVSKLL
ncbi:dTDP-4-dehydrorhamnose reductase [Neisseria meningitidis]|uniref:dTDP-4-dehydrorhamnose reductase n=1 Tax=Neisseria meningitidis TaxID=487 RepID=UPI0002A4E5EA|nr:dTDP-4-dehydrorhamnose reductase [Neisseria meningitidis]ELL29481.1 dTDP-4-dehydrorhamnose reductase [Neisseria meningitidis 77221]